MPARKSAAASPIAAILKRLKKAYPEAPLALNFSSPLELLVALILAAQCTDQKVNEVTARIFKKYRTARDWAEVGRGELEDDVRQTGFYRNKARAIQECCRQLVDEYGGEVPEDLDDLLRLRGVGRKTANILRGQAFGIPGIGVDTHVLRLSQRLGLTKQSDPDKVEADLTAVVPRAEQILFCTRIQIHGRRVCFARKPGCYDCVLADLCPFPKKTPPPPPPRPAFGRRV